jgi:hypothetical protein
MEQCTTLHALDRERTVLTSLEQLDSLYQAENLAAYEQTWQEICQQVRHLFPGFTVAYAELYTAGHGRNAHGGMRHVLLPLSERNGQ